jgi:glutamine synthetase
VMLVSALDGIDRGLTPPAPLNNINVYHLDQDERSKLGVTELPGSLREALLELEQDAVVKAALGETLYETFWRAKWAEWEDYRLHVMDWEVGRYLETA